MVSYGYKFLSSNSCIYRMALLHLGEVLNDVKLVGVLIT